MVPLLVYGSKVRLAAVVLLTETIIPSDIVSGSGKVIVAGLAPVYTSKSWGEV